MCAGNFAKYSSARPAMDIATARPCCSCGMPVSCRQPCKSHRYCRSFTVPAGLQEGGASHLRRSPTS
eukprot:12096943-Alexandrium_andersonii.AAC.1